MDQLSKSDEVITSTLVSNEVGSISNKKISDLIENLNDNEIENINKIFNELESANLSYKVFVKKLILSLSEYSIKLLEDPDQSRLSFDDCKNIVIELNDILMKINISVNPYLIIKMIFLSYTKNAKIEINKSEKNIKSNVENLAEVPRKTEVKNEKKLIKNDVMQMVDIRINNCFVNATKNYLNEVKEKWNNFVSETEDAIIKGLVSDTLIVAASDNYAIVEVTIPHKDEELNDSIEKLENMFSELNKMYYKFVFIDERKWNEEKGKYIKNLRNGYKYELIPENKKVEDKNELDISDVADIFDIEKIEIE